MMHVILGSPLPDTTDTDTIRIRFDTRLSYDSVVMETVQEPETAVFFGAKCLYTVQRQGVGSGKETEDTFKVFSVG